MPSLGLSGGGNGKPRVTGARAKSVGAPPGGAPVRPPGSASSGTAAKADVEEYRARLIELYKVHNPSNLGRVDHLLEKYRGNEDFLYKTVCAKYKKQAAAAAAAQKAQQQQARSSGAVAPRSASNATGPPLLGDVNGAAPGKQALAVKPAANGSHSGAAAARLLARIDVLLLGDRTGFFERAVDGCPSDASGSASETASDDEEEEEEEEAESGGSSEEEDDVVTRSPLAGTDDRSAAPAATAKSKAAAMAVVAATAKPKAKPLSAPQADVGDGKQLSHVKASPAKSSGRRPAGEDESEMSDEGLAAAMGAALGGGSEASRPQSDQRRRGDGADSLRRHRRQGSEDEALSDRGDAAGDAQDANAKVKAASPSARAGEHEVDNAKDAPPPLFDQWLACLKFLVGWNEAAPVPPEKLKDALLEHLREEGIESKSAKQQLCSTVTGLLADVRKVDKAVIKNVKMAVLKTAKAVQISILRVVVFEMTRALAAQGTKKNKAEGKRPKAEDAPYLAGDISSLAKVVQHFRFEKAFSGGLHNLITSFRQQIKSLRASGKKGEKAQKATDGGAGSKRRKVAAVEETAASKTAEGDGADVQQQRKRARIEPSS
eukprot:TRINITY_DN15471_c0_g1_i1.p1 TRINITY_DN15471_c0_g1~~TRINITY_DN15471_c0_g1_i1.p1  ORF type:complete len:603 (-),score=207.24 TRINITY_DN15471_c0_g1_i1:99-1907(-)